MQLLLSGLYVLLQTLEAILIVIIVRIFSILLENDSQEKIFYDSIHPAELIPKIIQVMVLCSTPMKEYKRGVELVAEAVNALKALLLSCGNIITEKDINEITADKRKAVFSQMKEVLTKTEDICDLLTYNLERALQLGDDHLIATNKILFFIRVLLEVDSFLQKSLSSSDSLPWNMKDRFSSATFVENILIKLLEKEITYFGTIPLITEASWQLTLKAITLYSWDEARLTSVYLKKRHSIHRIRTILQVLSACLSVDSLRIRLSAISGLAVVDFCDLWKDFPLVFVHPAGNNTNSPLSTLEVGSIN